MVTGQFVVLYLLNTSTECRGCNGPRNGPDRRSLGTIKLTKTAKI